MPKAKQADVLRDLSKYSKYEKLLARAKRAAKSGAREIQVIKADIDDDAYERLEAEGLTLNYVDYGSYKAFKIGW